MADQTEVEETTQVQPGHPQVQPELAAVEGSAVAASASEHGETSADAGVRRLPQS